MPFLTYQFPSETLGLHVTANVILPQSHCAGDDTKTLYLHHGLSHDHTIWCRYTSIELYARENNIAVVMPNADRSFFANMARGLPYWTYISEEVPYIMRKTFGLSAKRENNFAAGYSMGGYGALKHGLLQPDKFFAIGMLSAVTDYGEWIEECTDPNNKEYSVEDVNRFGSAKEFFGSENDLIYHMKRSFRENISLPRIYQYIGREDGLYEQNLRFRDLAKDLHIPVKYVEDDGGHYYTYWDKQINEFIKWALGEE